MRVSPSPVVFLKAFVSVVFICSIYTVISSVRFGVNNRIIIQSSTIRDVTTSKVLHQNGLLLTRPPPLPIANKSSAIHISSYKQILSFMDSRRWPLTVFVSSGQLGNNIHSYALSLALQQKFPVATFAVSDKVFNFTKSVIAEESLTLPIISLQVLLEEVPKNLIVVMQPKWSEGDFSSYVVPSIRSLLGQVRILVLEAYSLDLFEGYEDFLFNSLHIRQDLKLKASAFLKMTASTFIKEENLRNITFVGVHVRRGNYVNFVKIWSQIASLPGKNFYSRAFTYYNSHLQNPVYVVCSDDLQYVKHAFRQRKHVVYCNGSAAEDFAMLASCSHSIMTVGSFGFWASFFAGGNVVFAQLKDSVRIPQIDPGNMGGAFINFLPLSSS